MCLTSEAAAKLPSRVAEPSYIPTSDVWEFADPHQHLVSSAFPVVGILLGVCCLLMEVQIMQSPKEHHLCMFFSEMSVHFCTFLNVFSEFLLISILDIKKHECLCQMCFHDVFSQFLACLFVFQTSFMKHSFKMKPNILSTFIDIFFHKKLF